MRRGCLLLAFLLLPLSGCTGGQPAAVTLFDLVGEVAADPTPVPVPDCEVLLQTLNHRALTEAQAALKQAVEGGYGYAVVGVGGWAMEDSDASAPRAMSAAGTGTAAAGGSAEALAGDGRQATGTNNQEAGADEGDLVKTDGTWTYVVTQAGDLYVLRHDFIGDVRNVSRTQLGSSWSGGELLLWRGDAADPADDRLVAVLPHSVPAEDEARILSSSMRERATQGMTRILVLSLADRAAPAIESETFVEGSAAGVRLIGGVAHVVVQRYPAELGLQTWPDVSEDRGFIRNLVPDSWLEGDDATRRQMMEDAALAADARNRERVRELTLRDHLPLVLASDGGAATPEPMGQAQCRQVLAVPGPTGRAVSTVLSIDVAGDLAKETVQVLGASSIVYASPEALVLAAPTAEAWWASAQANLPETTDLHWFDLDGLDVTHRASGRVTGSLVDQFALDVRDGRLRVASTLNMWGWRAVGPMVSQVVVLDPVAGALVPAGIVGGIAPTERIWSVRFTDERAYLVTFRNMDPLWVVDLSGTAPALLGELEIPGVSTYLHPVDDRTLLAIGHGPMGEDGLGVDMGSVQVSLFDLTDLSKPRRADVLDLATGGAGSQAIHEHKAFTYWPEVGKLAIPIERWEHWGYDGRLQSTLELIDVDLDAQTLAPAGSLNQSGLPPVEAYGYAPGIERSFFLGFPSTGPVSVYAVSQRGITGHDLQTLQPQGAVAFAAAAGYGGPVYID